VNLSADEVADVPLGAVTVTATVPAVPAGLVTVIDVALFTVNAVALVLPKVTLVAPVKPLPVIVTEVPPVVDPWLGATFVIMGADPPVTYLN